MTTTPPTTEELTEAAATAAEFDTQRSCWWNSCNHMCRYDDAPEFQANEVPAYASLGSMCWGTLLELALLHTLRPCKDCGGVVLYKSGYQIACCSCFGDSDRQCEDCENGGCKNCAENMNLPDAITRWNLWYGDTGAAGRVEVIG